MPLFRINDQLVFFAHVPKCAGTSIEHLLMRAGVPMAFHDARHYGQPEEVRWSRSSPQHVDTGTLARLFPEGFLDACFSVVRHPEDRLISVFRFQREIEGRIPANMEIGAWLARLAENRAGDLWHFDNHARPMTEMVPEGAQVFRMEDGMDHLLSWLRDLCGPGIQLPPEIPRSNVLKERLAHSHLPDQSVTLSAEARALLAELYAADFQRFGYTPGKPA